MNASTSDATYGLLGLAGVTVDIHIVVTVSATQVDQSPHLLVDQVLPARIVVLLVLLQALARTYACIRTPTSSFAFTFPPSFPFPFLP